MKYAEVLSEKYDDIMEYLAEDSITKYNSAGHITYAYSCFPILVEFKPYHILAARLIYFDEERTVHFLLYRPAIETIPKCPKGEWPDVFYFDESPITASTLGELFVVNMQRGRITNIEDETVILEDFYKHAIKFAKKRYEIPIFMSLLSQTQIENINKLRASIIKSQTELF